MQEKEVTEVIELGKKLEKGKPPRGGSCNKTVGKLIQGDCPECHYQKKKAKAPKPTGNLGELLKKRP